MNIKASGKVQALFITHRGQFHQQNVLSSAPEELEITMVRDATKEDVIQLLPGKQVFITEREDIIDADMIRAGKDLKLIQRLGGQTWDIDLDAARQMGIAVCYWPDQTCINVAEHCLAQTLDLMKKMRTSMLTMNQAIWQRESLRSDEDTFAYNWSGMSGIRTLRGATVGILGFGEIGRELALRLQGYETRVLYHKRRRMPARAEEQLGIHYSQPAEMIPQCDVVYCLLPYSQETDQSFNREFFNNMKPDSFFVFCGGSGNVDENALIQALQSGRLAGAALDTYTYEPTPPNSPLLDLHRDLSVNLVLTPHVAAGTMIIGRAGDYTNIRRLLAGEDFVYQVA